MSVAHGFSPKFQRHSYTSRFVHGGLFHPCRWPVWPVSVAYATRLWLKPELAEGAPKKRGGSSQRTHPECDQPGNSVYHVFWG
jgi:hypothetical protein